MDKGRKFFTMLLIILTILITVLLGYLAYKYISGYIVSKEAAKIVEEFENEVKDINTVEIDEENTIVNDIVNNVEQPPVQNTGSSQTTKSPQTTKKYKGYTVIGTIKIPKTKVSYPIVNSTSPNAMDNAIVLLYGAGLNRQGNTVIAGHNYRNGGFFGNNKKLQNGDKIYITDEYGKSIEYTIYNKYIAEDSDFSYATRNTNGKREISLSTCTSDSTKRLVIWAKEN